MRKTEEAIREEYHRIIEESKKAGGSGAPKNRGVVPLEYSSSRGTVDGRNPAPFGMVETL